jgi:four helix bundle protein
MDRKKEGWQKRLGSAPEGGKGRFSKKELKQFLYIARGSLYETVAMLQILKKKEWLDNAIYRKAYLEAEEISKMLSGLINSIQ